MWSASFFYFLFFLFNKKLLTCDPVGQKTSMQSTHFCFYLSNFFRAVTSFRLQFLLLPAFLVLPCPMHSQCDNFQGEIDKCKSTEEAVGLMLLLDGEDCFKSFRICLVLLACPFLPHLLMISFVPLMAGLFPLKVSSYMNKLLLCMHQLPWKDHILESTLSHSRIFPVTFHPVVDQQTWFNCAKKFSFSFCAHVVYILRLLLLFVPFHSQCCCTAPRLFCSKPTAVVHLQLNPAVFCYNVPISFHM